MNIIGMAFRFRDAVTAFAERARRFYHSVMLMGQACPGCGGRLAMIREGLCRCHACDCELDPTIAFQRCSECGGEPELKIRRYSCKQCGAHVPSRFLFNGLVLDADYFRKKMVESRQRKADRLETVRRMLAETRSLPLGHADPIQLDTVPGLKEALDGLIGGLEWQTRPDLAGGFDLKRYQRHIQAHLGTVPLSLSEVPLLGEDARKDLIWRFIAIVFMAHMGLIDIWQQDQDIMVMKRETNREGQDLSGDIEGVDGFEGSLGGAEA